MSPDIYVHKITHLKTKPRDKEALEYLKRVVSLVKPIMRKHNWHLPVLAEFYPSDPGLLGVNINKGQKICLRLRPHFDDSAFLEEQDVIGTMLHELTHNVHGPHDQTFYKFLSTLEDEFDALQRSGYAGEGFYSKGTRVGEGVSHDLPAHLAREKALQAAEKRRQIALVYLAMEDWAAKGNQGNQRGRWPLRQRKEEPETRRPVDLEPKGSLRQSRRNETVLANKLKIGSPHQRSFYLTGLRQLVPLKSWLQMQVYQNLVQEVLPRVLPRREGDQKEVLVRVLAHLQLSTDGHAQPAHLSMLHYLYNATLAAPQDRWMQVVDGHVYFVAKVDMTINFGPVGAVDG